MRYNIDEDGKPIFTNPHPSIWMPLREMCDNMSDKTNRRAAQHKYLKTKLGRPAGRIDAEGNSYLSNRDRRALIEFAEAQVLT